MEFNNTEGMINELIGKQTALTVNDDRPPFDFDPFCAIMKIWVVADYFRMPELLAALKSLEESRMNALGRELAMPGINREWGDPYEDGFKPCDAQLEHAIASLEAYADQQNYVVVDAFQPTIMRLILCGRHRFPTRPLCWERPELVEGWESLLDRPRLRFPHYARPQDGHCCRKCRKVLAVCNEDQYEIAAPIVLNMLGREMGDFLSWYCQPCYTVPTLAEWEEVKAMYRLNEEEAALRKQFDELHAVIKQQRWASWDRLRAANKSDETECVWDCDFGDDLV